MGLNLEKIETNPTVQIKVLVRFKGQGNSYTEGDFLGTFKRIDQERIEELMDPEEGYSNSDLLDEVLVSVSGIGRGDQELSPDEQLAWVKKTPECVNAAVVAFFKEFRPARYEQRTSSKRRSRG